MKFPVLISIPHCSSLIPEDVRPALALSEEQILESTDIGTREIFGALPAEGLVCARWSRLVIDLNRGAQERGPKGLIAELDYNGRRVYSPGNEPDGAEIERRLRTQYRPYHDALGRFISRPEVQALFDCHSMGEIGPAEAPDPGMEREDIVLGNNGGPRENSAPGTGCVTCPWDTLHGIKGAFEQEGFSVSLNTPYSGGFITKYYGEMMRKSGKIALQIEINKGLYADEGGLRIVPENTDRVRKGIFKVFEKIAGIIG